MKAGYIYFCYAFTASSLVDACSFFPDHKCCSSASSVSEKLPNIATTEDLISFDNFDFLRVYPNMSQISMADRSLPKSLRILCFGDSLTAGYMSSDPECYPYGDTLRTELAHMLSATPSQIHTRIDGLSGKALKCLRRYRRTDLIRERL